MYISVSSRDFGFNFKAIKWGLEWSFWA